MKAAFTITGRLQKSPTVATSKTGKSYAKLSVEVVSEEGGQERKVYFNDLMLWDKQAQKAADDFKENDIITLSGNIYVKVDTNQAGYKMAIPVLNIQEISKASKKGKSSKVEKEEVQEEPSGELGDDFDKMMEDDNQD